ncbi:hypothetical protein [Thiomicrorhabdus cannonii]|jgi:hypothetical protein|nr:hypothetical protein [Thiomicrorhabdus cannonii]
MDFTAIIAAVDFTNVVAAMASVAVVVLGLRIAKVGIRNVFSIVK